MKARHAWFWLLSGVPAVSGCGLYHNAVHNFHYESQLAHNDYSLKHDLRTQAHEFWRDYKALHPNECFSAYFADGFLDGFVDYLDNGGNGDPPATPPPSYRKNKYLTPEGYAAIEDYFAGFRLGSRIAIDSGIRDTLVVPVLIPLGTPAAASRSAGKYAEAAPAKAATEILPLPKRIEDEKEADKKDADKK